MGRGPSACPTQYYGVYTQKYVVDRRRAFGHALGSLGRKDGLRLPAAPNRLGRAIVGPMDLDYVRTFYQAASLKSITAAAKQLRLSQQGASAQIARLETQLGAPLIDRTRGDRRLRLTPAGERFVAQARQLLKLEQTIKTSLGLATAPTRLRVGANESVLHSWLVRWIAELHDSHPQLAVELTIETTAALSDLLARGGLDVSFATAAVSADGVRVRKLRDMPMVFVGHRPLHRKRSYSLADIADHDLLTFQRGSLPHAALLDALRKEGFMEARVHAVSSISAMARLVSAGFGIATLPADALTGFPAADGLKVLNATAGLPMLPIFASWRPDPVTGLVDELVDGATRFAGS